MFPEEWGNPPGCTLQTVQKKLEMFWAGREQEAGKMRGITEGDPEQWLKIRR